MMLAAFGAGNTDFLFVIVENVIVLPHQRASENDLIGLAIFVGGHAVFFTVLFEKIFGREPFDLLCFVFMTLGVEDDDGIAQEELFLTASELVGIEFEAGVNVALDPSREPFAIAVLSVSILVEDVFGLVAEVIKVVHQRIPHLWWHVRERGSRIDEPRAPLVTSSDHMLIDRGSLKSDPVC